ncbi:MAG: hypothetical protein MUC62_06065 [Candidatus Thermoplasmatota archaeon]|jgi:O-phosphoseryl-tRNA synthetase|nr:hypothetical protein [Candidatus Thermoplasmatota archaeon]
MTPLPDEEKDPQVIKDLGGKKGVNLEDIVVYFSGKGTPHPISEGVASVRHLMLESGFDELLTSHFIEAKDVKELLGKLHISFRDALFYLYTTRMVPMAPTREVEVQIARKFPSVDLAQLWNTLDDIDGTVSGEDLMVSLKHDLGLSIDEALDLLNMIPELSSGGLQATGLTLRAFMPISWLSTIEAVYDEKALPMRLFTVGTMFRREPVQDRTHMRTYNVLSLAVFDTDFTIEKGVTVLKRLLSSIEIEDTSFIEKTYSYPFFDKGTEYEVFVDGLEIGTCGMISSDVLSSMNVNANLFLADLGIERILMQQKKYPDIRKLFYPQFFSAWNISDSELASSIRYTHRPKTPIGRIIARSIEGALKGMRGKEESGPIVVWKGHLVTSGKSENLVSIGSAVPEGSSAIKAELFLEEAKEGMGLYGPGAFDQVWVKDGNIMGIPPTLAREIRSEGGYRTGKSYLKAFANYAGWKIERSFSRGSTSKSFEMVRRLEDINMQLTSKAQNYVLSRSRKVDVKGPVFLMFRFVLGSRTR